MTEREDTFIEDLYHRNRWEGMLAGAAPGEELDLGRVHRLVCEGAPAHNMERFGESWLASFLSYCERGGIGSLQAYSDGTYALVLAKPLPSRSEAWDRVATTWPEFATEPSG